MAPVRAEPQRKVAVWAVAILGVGDPGWGLEVLSVQAWSPGDGASPEVEWLVWAFGEARILAA